MRADARRNHDAVLDAGARLLAQRPTASMQEIADASGVGRTTVYRHFPAREDLIAALVTRVVEEAIAATTKAVNVETPATEVLRVLAQEFVALGRRWSFLRSQDTADDVRDAAGESDRLFRDWVVRAQERGELRTDLSADWLMNATRGLAGEAIAWSDRFGAEQATDLFTESLLSLMRARPR